MEGVKIQQQLVQKLDPGRSRLQPESRRQASDCHHPLMKCSICLFSLSTHLKCHIRPNTGFPLVRLINFATVKLAAANESDSEKRRSWRLLITQEANNGWHGSSWKPGRKKGRRRHQIELSHRGKNKWGEGEAGNLMMVVIGSGEQGFVPAVWAAASSGSLCWRR